MKVPFDNQIWLFILASALIVVLGEAIVVIWSLAWYWAVAVFVSAFLCLSYVATKHREQLFEDHFHSRPALDEEEFGLHYFPPDRAEIAARLRKILACHVDIDLSRMIPADRFIEDFRMDDFDSMSMVNFIIEVETQFGIEIPDSAAERMTTFQVVVDFVANALKTKVA